MLLDAAAPEPQESVIDQQVMSVTGHLQSVERNCRRLSTYCRLWNSHAVSQLQTPVVQKQNMMNSTQPWLQAHSIAQALRACRVLSCPVLPSDSDHVGRPLPSKKQINCCGYKLHSRSGMIFNPPPIKSE